MHDYCPPYNTYYKTFYHANKILSIKNDKWGHWPHLLIQNQQHENKQRFIKILWLENQHSKHCSKQQNFKYRRCNFYIIRCVEFFKQRHRNHKRNTCNKCNATHFIVIEKSRKKN